jgi:acetolactate synthase-1/2/3 large subunit
MDWLKEDGYTHCFFVGGGNVMHLLEAASRRFECVAVVHEVAAGIAAEYFNDMNPDNKKAFALVTAGPGLTNIVTAVGGAFLESRELLIIGGQAKTTDLSRGTVPQIGHQEIDGVGIVTPITKKAVLADRRLSKSEVLRLSRLSRTGRKGPVFIEMCLDVSAMTPISEDSRSLGDVKTLTAPDPQDLARIVELVKTAKRPLILIGGGVDRIKGKQVIAGLQKMGFPLATTWNGFDRVSSEYEFYAGRPNTYGMRWANIINQSSDLVIAVGTRLGIQQIGFAWEDYVAHGKVIQVDIDSQELNKGFPNIELGISSDAVTFLEALHKEIHEVKIDSAWQSYIKDIRTKLDKPDAANVASNGYIELHSFIRDLSLKLDSNDVIVPCSSGGTFNAVMQMFNQRGNQIVTTDKSLASMGYGLSGAIGAAIANPHRRTILMEGDGGFAQNLQELGTVRVQKLNLKMFIFSNRGYASIRTTQKAYFNDNYVGCDEETGLGLPEWRQLFQAFGIAVQDIDSSNAWDSEMAAALNTKGPQAFIIHLDPEQLFYPKITSRVLSDGTMKTNPLHLMSPPLDDEVAEFAFRYLPATSWKI